MPVQPQEVQWFLSNPNAGTGFSGIGTPGNSLGKYMSTTQVSPVVTTDNLFLDISGPQNAATQVDYQCVFLMNNTSSGLSMTSIYVSFPTMGWTPGGAGLALGVDPTGALPYNTSSQQAVVIANSLAAPAGVTQWFPGPHALFSSGLLAHTLQPFYAVAIWIQRSALNTPALTPQTALLTATYQSNA